MDQAVVQPWRHLAPLARSAPRPPRPHPPPPTAPGARSARRRLGHNLGLVIAKAVRGQLTAGVPAREILRQAALFAVQNRDGWGIGATILTALGNLLPVLPDQETYLALFHGARRVAADCEGEAPRRERALLASRPDLSTLQRWPRHLH